MGNGRRVARIAASDSEDEPRHEEEVAPPSSQSKKKPKLAVEEEEEEEEEEPEPEEENETPQEDAKPAGEVIKVSGKGKFKKEHYEAFEFDGNRYQLEDSVLLTPEDSGQKPYVAIIKDVAQGRDGSVMVTGQWFYRPEEAEKKEGGNWEPRDTRELFYSFHRDEVPAESVMHKCVTHFIPLGKQFPNRSVNPGFIVQKVYDTVEKKLWKLTDKDYEDNKQHEIDLLVEKTRERLGEFLDIETEETHQNNDVETEDDITEEIYLKMKRFLQRKNMLSVDVSGEDGANNRPNQHLTADTPGSYKGEVSEAYKILVTFKVLTGHTVRDRWIERLLEVIHSIFDTNGDIQDGDKEKKGGGTIRWPDSAVPVAVAVERATHDALSSDFQKYNQKMRSLVFNLKTNALLSRRLLSGELDASVVPHMSPNELKDGLAAKEKETNEPDESEHMQMTDARCPRCKEKKVGLTDIIQAGARGDRYQLECIACGNSWYAFRDEVSTLTIEGPSVARNVGTAPWATAKFEDVEKKMLSPRGAAEKSDAVDLFMKPSSEPRAPALEPRKSFNKSRAEDSSTRNKTE